MLKEFNYRCAICAIDNPQLHHIDETPSNNDPMNLVPLCPNCHLIDQHNPTRTLDPIKLSLFRKFKDPFILKSQFDPLF
ncbi:MAG: HNH endonuclease, partial [Acidobacteriota bacterium]|nr:HNH endonuclease [Acidobacteriota bacterium]